MDVFKRLLTPTRTRLALRTRKIALMTGYCHRIQTLMLHAVSFTPRWRLFGTDLPLEVTPRGSDTRLLYPFK